MRWITIIPLRNFSQIQGFEKIDFGSGSYFARIPDWLRSHPFLALISVSDREELESLTHAFITEYEADALGSPDPRAPAAYPRSIQDAKVELGIKANIALCIAKGTPVNSRMAFHAFESGRDWSIQQFVRPNRLLCHPNDQQNQYSSDDIDVAKRLFASISNLDLDSSVYVAIRSLWSALTSNPPVRYVLLWIALEALFGPSDGREMTYRLSQRIAFFLAEDSASRLEQWQKIKNGYAVRSKVVHGRWGKSLDDQAMYDTEAMVRASMLKILPDAALLRKFSGNAREDYLEGLVFGNDGSEARLL